MRPERHPEGVAQLLPLRRGVAVALTRSQNPLIAAAPLLHQPEFAEPPSDPDGSAEGEL